MTPCRQMSSQSAPRLASKLHRWVVFLLASLLWPPPADAQRFDIAQDLEEAKLLYRRGYFELAADSLRAVLDNIEREADLAVRHLHLADAYFHLGLTQVALEQAPDAKQSFKESLKSFPERHLDPEVYSKRVIDIFDQAKREMGKVEAAPPVTAPGANTPAENVPSPEGETSTSKLPYIVVAGAGAATGVALAAAGGDDSSAVSDSTNTSTNISLGLLGRPIPQANDVTLVMLSPPPMSSVSSQSVVSVMLLLNVAGPDQAVVLSCLFSSLPEGECGRCTISSPIAPGTGTPLTLAIPLSDFRVNSVRSCGPPGIIERLEVRLHSQKSLEGPDALIYKIFPVNYELN